MRDRVEHPREPFPCSVRQHNHSEYVAARSQRSEAASLGRWRAAVRGAKSTRLRQHKGRRARRDERVKAYYEKTFIPLLKRGQESAALVLAARIIPAVLKSYKCF